MLSKSWVAGIAGIVFAFSAAQAGADTINVNPGPNAIQDAVDDAGAGDTLRIRRGTYREDVEVDKRLKLIGRDGKRPVIDSECDSSVTLDAQVNGVTFRHLKVQGTDHDEGPGYTVNFAGVERGTVEDVVVKESCPGSVPEYGINLYDTGAIQVLGNRAFGGYTDAGIYVGSITDTGTDTLRVNDNVAYGNNRGIIIEEVAATGTSVVVRDNLARDNTIGGVGTPTGIFLHDSANTRYIDNRTIDNGDYGIHIDDGSDNNIFIGNASNRNGEEDFFDQGSGNCGSGNSFSIDPC